MIYIDRNSNKVLFYNSDLTVFSKQKILKILRGKKLVLFFIKYLNFI